MIDGTDIQDDIAESYRKNGFTVAPLFTAKEVKTIREFTRDWMSRLLSPWVKGREESYPLETYHEWWDSIDVDHDSLFRAKNRHTIPPDEVGKALINDRLNIFLKQIGIPEYSIWDEGLGWLAFRFIRPGMNDGYPLSRKEWGVAKKVISLWIPVIGYSSHETLALVPGSHVKEYEKYLPDDEKFCKGEFRLSGDYSTIELFRPDLKEGEAILFHPKTLHTEDVTESDITRLSLEFRLDPKDVAG